MAKSNSLNRRQFIKLMGAAGAGIVLAGCQPKETPFPPTPTRLAETATPNPTAAPLPSPTGTEASSPQPGPEPGETAQPAAATPLPYSAVATGRVQGYESGPLKAELERMAASLGGLAGLVKPGAAVGIKVNLTGGTWWDTPDKPPATELFVTHPAVVGALCELLRDAGAGRIIVMDGIGDPTSFDAWGYTAMAAPLGLELLDLCKPNPYPAYDLFPVGPKSVVYSQFLLNQTLKEIDVLVSVAKMKMHSVGGVTLALKNLFGLAPISEYRRSPNDNHRSYFHESVAYDSRVPRVIVDLNLACPVHFAVIDGIITGEGGAGPWDAGLSQVKPGLLLAGRDPVAVDAVATAVMGHDPQAPSGSPPFTHCDNYLAYAREAGLGTNILNEIPISGPSIADLRFPFLPAG